MKGVVAFGNPIVDLIYSATEDFIASHQLAKGTFTLFDESMLANLSPKLETLRFEGAISGGSAANTLATLAQLSAKHDFENYFIGKIGDDEIAAQFQDELTATSAIFLALGTPKGLTARCIVLVTEDAQRTMCTHLGCAANVLTSELSQHAELATQAQILYIEGYALGDSAIELIDKTPAQIALNLSDKNVVEFKRAQISGLFNKVHFLFGNQIEFEQLASVVTSKANSNQGLARVQNYFRNILRDNPNLKLIVTREEKGCAVLTATESFLVEASAVPDVLDTTGAGDSFVAGFLFGLLKQSDLKKCAEIGNLVASKIIQKIGARFNNEEVAELRNNLF